MRMPFGKHAGVELPDVPRPYLRWLRRQPWLGTWLAKEIDDELSEEAAASDEGSFEEALEKLKQENCKNERTPTHEQ
jgi:hypothetical protein